MELRDHGSEDWIRVLGIFGISGIFGAYLARFRLARELVH